MKRPKLTISSSDERQVRLRDEKTKSAEKDVKTTVKTEEEKRRQKIEIRVVDTKRSEKSSSSGKESSSHGKHKPGKIVR